jgi:hypothetical protein
VWRVEPGTWYSARGKQPSPSLIHDAFASPQVSVSCRCNRESCQLGVCAHNCRHITSILSSCLCPSCHYLVVVIQQGVVARHEDDASWTESNSESFFAVFRLILGRQVCDPNTLRRCHDATESFGKDFRYSSQKSHTDAREGTLCMIPVTLNWSHAPREAM